jgi:hypothetical protein
VPSSLSAPSAFSSSSDISSGWDDAIACNLYPRYRRQTYARLRTKNLRESQQLCHEHWLRRDIADLTSNGTPLWDGKARLRARRSTEDEVAAYQEAARVSVQPQDDLLLAYLVELDGASGPLD